MKISHRILLLAVLIMALPLRSLADIPSPARDACANKAAGERCDPGNGAGIASARAHQCLPSTCRSPGAHGSEYVCLICQEAPTAQQRQWVPGWSVAAPAPATAEPTTAEPAKPESAKSEPTTSAATTEPPESPRLWTAFAFGLVVLGVGTATIARAIRKRRS